MREPLSVVNREKCRESVPEAGPTCQPSPRIQLHLAPFPSVRNRELSEKWAPLSGPCYSLSSDPLQGLTADRALQDAAHVATSLADGPAAK
jgi:hypothetical protein